MAKETMMDKRKEKQILRKLKVAFRKQCYPPSREMPCPLSELLCLYLCVCMLLLYL